jgi:probable rRNA maturation factor
VNVVVHARGERAPRPLLRAALIQAVKATLRSEHSRARGEVNVILTDRATIRRLNRRFLDETGDTDVIAFPYDGPEIPDFPFGDIYISVPVARENARRFHDEADRELIRLAVHGTLHLLGYEDHSRKDHAEMWKRQELLVARLMGRGAAR